MKELRAINPEVFATASFKGFASVPDLCMSLHDYLESHWELAPAKKFLDSMCSDNVLVDSKSTPLGVFVKVVPPETLHKFLSSSIFPSELPVWFLQGGYDQLTQAMAKSLIGRGVKVLFNTSVERVSVVAGKPVIHRAEGFEPVMPDLAVMTTVWHAVDHTKENVTFIEGLPVTSMLQAAQSQILNPCGLSFPVEAVSEKWGDFLPTDPPEFNKVTSLYKKNEAGTTFQCLSHVVLGNSTWEEIEEEVFRDGEKLVNDITGRNDAKALPQHKYYCAIQPVATPKLLASGFYDRLESYQGVNGFYYANMYFSFSFSGIMVQYAKEVTEQMSKDSQSSKKNQSFKKRLF